LDGTADMTSLLSDLSEYLVLFVPMIFAVFAVATVLSLGSVMGRLRSKKPVQNPVWFEIEYTYDMGYVVRPLVPEAVTFAGNHMAHLRLGNSECYKICRPWISTLWAAGVERGWRVTVIAWEPQEEKEELLK